MQSFKARSKAIASAVHQIRGRKWMVRTEKQSYHHFFEFVVASLSWANRQQDVFALRRFSDRQSPKWLHNLGCRCRTFCSVGPFYTRVCCQFFTFLPLLAPLSDYWQPHFSSAVVYPLLICGQGYLRLSTHPHKLAIPKGVFGLS